MYTHVPNISRYVTIPSSNSRWISLGGAPVQSLLAHLANNSYSIKVLGHVNTFLMRYTKSWSKHFQKVVHYYYQEVMDDMYKEVYQFESWNVAFHIDPIVIITYLKNVMTFHWSYFFFGLYYWLIIHSSIGFDDLFLLCFVMISSMSM